MVSCGSPGNIVCWNSSSQEEFGRNAEPVFFAVLRQWIKGVAETTLADQFQGSPGHPAEDFNLECKYRINSVLCTAEVKLTVAGPFCTFSWKASPS